MFKQSVDCIIYLISYLTALINAPIFILLQDRTYLSSYPYIFTQHTLFLLLNKYVRTHSIEPKLPLYYYKQVQHVPSSPRYFCHETLSYVVHSDSYYPNLVLRLRS